MQVYGINLDSQTRCRHYHGDLDIVAIKFKCCQKYYACYFCHLELESHPSETWNLADFQVKVILCGQCGKELTWGQYTSFESSCFQCGAKFNPNCKKHWDLYFEGLDLNPL